MVVRRLRTMRCEYDVMRAVDLASYSELSIGSDVVSIVLSIGVFFGGRRLAANVTTKPLAASFTEIEWNSWYVIFAVV